MQNKSDTVSRKFVDVIDLDDYEVLTDDGWADVTSINKTIKYEVWEIETTSFKLKCADNHIVFDENMNEIFVKDVIPGKNLIFTQNGFEEVISVKNLEFEDNMYDLALSDESNHRYFTDGILSHNSTIYCIYTLWKACFFPEQKIMLLANKAATALELLGRVSMAYSYLPSFLKPSCVVYNKGEISFANKSTIKGFASSSDAARGFSANCVNRNTWIYIRFKNKLLRWIKIPIKIKWLKYFGYDILEI